MHIIPVCFISVFISFSLFLALLTSYPCVMHFSVICVSIVSGISVCLLRFPCCLRIQDARKQFPCICLHLRVCKNTRFIRRLCLRWPSFHLHSASRCIVVIVCMLLCVRRCTALKNTQFSHSVNPLLISLNSHIYMPTSS